MQNIEKTLSDELCPPVSIVIPTLNSAQKVGLTIDSVLAQNYPDFEIIIVDAGSFDRTLEIVKSYREERIRLCSVTGYNRYEMLNKGIAISHGLYVNFLFPGDYYIHHRTLMQIMSLGHENKLPELLFSGCLLREAQKEVKILYRPLSLDLLKQGKQPTSLQSCWFKASLFDKIGKFSPQLTLRGGFDLLCRFMLDGNFHYVSTNHVLTDYDLRGVTRSMVVQHFKETLQVLNRRFGLWTASKWLFRQNELGRYFNLWLKSVQVAVLGRD